MVPLLAVAGVAEQLQVVWVVRSAFIARDDVVEVAARPHGAVGPVGSGHGSISFAS